MPRRIPFLVSYAARFGAALLLVAVLTATLMVPHALARALNACEGAHLTAATTDAKAPDGAPVHAHDDHDARDCPCPEEAGFSSVDLTTPPLREGALPPESTVAHTPPTRLPTGPVPIRA